jgi:hypothetical protein
MMSFSEKEKKKKKKNHAYDICMPFSKHVNSVMQKKIIDMS